MRCSTERSPGNSGSSDAHRDRAQDALPVQRAPGAHRPDAAPHPVRHPGPVRGELAGRRGLRCAPPRRERRPRQRSDDALCRGTDRGARYHGDGRGAHQRGERRGA
ncbi:hypothetical protein QU38_00825, partial [Staphylococcus aureus]